MTRVLNKQKSPYPKIRDEALVAVPPLLTQIVSNLSFDNGFLSGTPLL